MAQNVAGGKRKETIIFFILRMGKRMETHSLRIANKVWTKKISQYAAGVKKIVSMLNYIEKKSAGGKRIH